ncbi:MAG: helix-turn-helix transcriptional regulator [Clostridia bacterium]|nr:helix-turn-helix transcriptional regulator [Clostridia bacterium]
MMTLGQRIMQLRQAAGMSQETLGERLDTTRQTVSRWELDQIIPGVERIVRLSRIFGVTTDSLLVEGISTFAGQERFLCGVYRDGSSEIVETERFAYVLSEENGALCARLYTGGLEEKQLTALCVRREGMTHFAYRMEDGRTIATASPLAAELGQGFDRMQLGRMRRRERFRADHSGAALPTVSQAGIRRCLTAWRMGASLTADEGQLFFFLCTGRTEYVMQLRMDKLNVYCGASFNQPFDMGLMSGGQYFRIRSEGDNSAPYCGIFSDFSYMPKPFDIPTEELQPGMCVSTSRGLMWCVKRYHDEQIVLQGCGDDEYIYRRGDRRMERYLPAED